MNNRKQAVATIREFNRFYTNIIGLVNHHLPETAYTLSEARVLYEINHTPRCTARGIINSLQIDEGYLSRILDRFVKQGLVKKSRSAEDKRAWLLTLTAKGKTQFGQLNKASETSIAAITATLTEKELQQLVELMNGIRTILLKK